MNREGAGYKPGWYAVRGHDGKLYCVEITADSIFDPRDWAEMLGFVPDLLTDAQLWRTRDRT